MHNLFFNLLMIIPTLQKEYNLTETIISVYLTKLKDEQWMVTHCDRVHWNPQSVPIFLRYKNIGGGK